MPPPTAKPPVFVFFARAVEGHMVARYSDGPGPYPQIGVTMRRPTPEELKLDPELVAGPVWDLETIHAFTRREMDAFGRFYRRAVKEGALEECKPEAFEAFQKAQAERGATADKAAAEKSKAPDGAETTPAPASSAELKE